VSYLSAFGAAMVGFAALVLLFGGIALLENAPYERQRSDLQKAV